MLDLTSTVVLGSNPLHCGLTELVPRTADVHGGVDVSVGHQTVTLSPLTAPRGPEGTPLGTVTVRLGPVVNPLDRYLVLCWTIQLDVVIVTTTHVDVLHRSGSNDCGTKLNLINITKIIFLDE